MVRRQVTQEDNQKSEKRQKLMLLEYFRGTLMNPTLRQIYFDFEEYKSLNNDEQTREMCSLGEDELLKYIYQNIPPDKLYSLIYAVYDQLNEKYDLEHYQLDKNKIEMHRALDNLVTYYWNKEAKKSTIKSVLWTIAFCIPVVTIPFVTLFYQYARNYYLKNQVFQMLAVPNSLLDQLWEKRPTGTKYINGALVSQKNEKTKSHGSMNMLMMTHKDPKTFKEILFNKKNQVRKFIRGSEGPVLFSKEGGYDGRKTILLGSKDQIERLTSKLDTRFFINR